MTPSIVLSQFLLIAIRVSLFFLSLSLQPIKCLPTTPKFILILALAFTLFQSQPIELNSISSMELLFAGLIEGINGFTLALPLIALFALFNVAGELMDIQIGLSAMSLFNPQSGDHNGPIATLLSLLATLYFIHQGGLSSLFNLLTTSFKLTPPGHLLALSHPSTFLDLGALIFKLALQLALPILALIFAIDLLSMVLTKDMPRLQLYFLSLPVKIGLGLCMLASLQPSYVTHISSYFTEFTRLLFGVAP